MPRCIYKSQSPANLSSRRSRRAKTRDCLRLNSRRWRNLPPWACLHSVESARPQSQDLLGPVLDLQDHAKRSTRLNATTHNLSGYVISNVFKEGTTFAALLWKGVHLLLLLTIAP